MPRKRITVLSACAQCGTTFESAVWFAAQAPKFCSASCRAIGQVRPEAKPVDVICEACGTTFGTFPSRLGRRKYCSAACRHAGRAVPRLPFDVYFWSKVDKNGSVPAHRPELGPCWVWTLRPDAYGYGQVHVGSRRDDTRTNAKAHQVALEMQLGRRLIEGMGALHKCDNRICVRNDGESSHLFEGTPADNIHDMIVKGRAHWQKDRPDA